MDNTGRKLNDITIEEHVVIKTLEEHAERNGDKQFLYYGENEKRFTYKEFNEISNSIGNELKSLGLTKGERVSVFMKNALTCTMSMFGIWKAGAVFAPINFNYRGKSLSYIINDTNPFILIIERALLPELDKIKDDLKNKNLKVVVYTPDEGDHDYHPAFRNQPLKANEISFGQLLNGTTSSVGVEVDYFDSASIIYTSGTTGMPKGVVQPHRWIYAYSYYFGKILNEDDCVYNDLPMYHVGGAFFNITRAVFAGCSVALWDKFSSSDFWNRINKSKSTTAVLVGVMTTWLMNAEKRSDDRLNTLNKIHIQPLPSYHQELAKRFGFDFILAGFGQTESGFSVCGLIQELDEESGTPPEYYIGYSREQIVDIAKELGLEVLDGNSNIEKGYLGKKASFIEATILNESDEECKPYEIGELAFRPKIPALLMSEYYNNHDATLKAFSNLWLHTGDSAYKDEQNTFYFVDRKNSILKVRGEKFSSYQVEDLIYEHPLVQMSAVFPISEEYGDEIALYVVIKEETSMSEEELREWIEENLPKYMWPKYIRFVDEIPKTLTNKVQKFKLKEALMKELELTK